MRAYLIRRVLLLVPVLAGVITLVFLFIHFIPGDPVVLMLGETAQPADIVELRHLLGLDLPPFPLYRAAPEIDEQGFDPVVLGRWRLLWRWRDIRRSRYVAFLGGLVRGDLGRSIVPPYRSVSVVIREKIPYTAVLAAASLFVALGIALPLGIVSALRVNTLVDRLTMLVALLGISMPNFWLGPMLIILFSLKLGWLPVSGPGGPEHLVLPAITLGTALAALLTRMVRSSLLEVLRSDYITTARAKGLPERVVILKHALRNALIPVITIVGLQFGALLGGSIITEKIFSWPGIGRELLKAIQQRDYPVVQGCVLVIAFSYVLINLLTDLVYGLVDPRIRLGEEG